MISSVYRFREFNLFSRTRQVLHEGDWVRALTGADADEVLKTRGVKPAEVLVMKASLNVIAAVLKYNNMTYEEGFDAFDVDGDNKLSIKDLQTSAEILQLDLTSARPHQRRLRSQYGCGTAKSLVFAAVC